MTVTLEPCATLVGRLVDDEGVPFPGVEVQASPAPGQYPYFFIPIVVSHADGRFECRGLFPGCDYGLVVHGSEVKIQYPSKRIAIEPGKTIDLGNVKLERTARRIRNRRVAIAEPGNGVDDTHSERLARSLGGDTVPSDAAPWNLARVVHLHRRAGFAATWTEIERDLREGPEPSVTRLVKGNAHLDGTLKDFESVSAALAESAASTSTADRLKAWWVFRMLFSPDPLGERLTLMWHNHFATSNFKVNDLGAMRRQNDIFREFARAPFGELFIARSRIRALLDWLDAPANRREHPNENLARESMELFTIGVGNFTEKDVKEAARALTGWSYKPDGFREFPQYHDDGEKKILGRKDAFAATISSRSCSSNRPRPCVSPGGCANSSWARPMGHVAAGRTQNTEALVASLAAGLREHHLDIGWGVERILRSQVFFDADNLKSRVLAPPEFAVGAARALRDLRSAAEHAPVGRVDRPHGAGPVLSAERLRLAGRTIVAQLADTRRADQFRVRARRGERASTRPLRCNILALVEKGVGRRDAEMGIRFLSQLVLGSDPSPGLERDLHAAAGSSANLTAEGARRVAARLLASPEGQLG